MASTGQLVVAAIDFGTTFSGWAYSFLHEYHADATKCTVKYWNPGTGSVLTEKTPTVILIKPDGKTIEAFGYDAENRYITLVENDEHRDYYYFRRFKMSLDRKQISRDLKIEDEMGRKLRATTVFALSIKYLANDLITTGGNTVDGGITMNDIHWVLTVPAIWTDAAKQFMREAAVEAGIKTEKLSIALEPEAASVFCRHLPVVKPKDEASYISTLPTGAKYMILDAGGGTIDITVHQVTSSGGLKEIHAASGGGWGGILVDEAFEKLLKDLFSEKVYGTFVEKDTEDWVDLWRTFEVKKKTIDSESSAAVNMKLPSSLLRLFTKTTGQEVEKMIENSKYSSQIKIRGGDKVRFDSKLMKEIFTNSIGKTVSHVKSVLRDEKAKDVGIILMVGGFSESLMLRNAIKTEFRNIRIVIPKEASSSILRGAVAFGHNPKSISQRILKRTYGIETKADFKEGVHPEHLRKFIYGQDLCDKIFCKHVEIHQSVVVGEHQIEKYYEPLSNSQNSISFPVYASCLKNPLYTEHGCEPVGKLEVDISKLPKDLSTSDKNVFVSLSFSGTEITATGRVERTGEKTSATFDFLE